MMLSTQANCASARLKTEIGVLQIAASDEGLVAVVFPIETRRHYDTARGSTTARTHLDAAMSALQEYFAESRTDFEDLTLAPSGTVFQMSVWRALRQIPFGITKSYGDIARAIGNPKGVRAVAKANGYNRIAIIIPCHRVIGDNGNLTGYGGGLWRKKWLLDFESKQGSLNFL